MIRRARMGGGELGGDGVERGDLVVALRSSFSFILFLLPFPSLLFSFFFFFFLGNVKSREKRKQGYRDVCLAVKKSLCGFTPSPLDFYPSPSFLFSFPSFSSP